MSDIENTTGADIIDATQNAVVEAVTNVSQMIEKTSAESVFESGGTHEVFYASAEFWVGVAFVLVVIVLSKPVFRVLKSLLNRRRNRIIDEMNEAANLKLDAQNLLARYERLFLNTQNEIDALVADIQKEFQAYAASQKQLLENELKQNELKAEREVEAAIEKIRDEINLQIAQKTMDIVLKRLKNIDSKQKSKLIDESIDNILNQLPLFLFLFLSKE